MDSKTSWADQTLVSLNQFGDNNDGSADTELHVTR